jgi:TRAP-type C4-dicarboxylate transport system permease small subunit
VRGARIRAAILEMQAESRSEPADESGAHRFLMRVCERVAFVGGIALLGTMATMLVTVVGAAFNHPLLGDSEIVEFLGGIAVFAFLPYCHLRGANIIVDYFTQPLPEAARAWLDALMNAVFAAVAALLTWRLIEGGVTAFERNRRSMFLQLPDWWGYAVGGAAMILWVVVCVFVAWERAQQARRMQHRPTRSASGPA